jgi:hypothetical protein
MRVPGGWIYTIASARENETHSSVFVPFHDEFKVVSARQV